MANLDFINNSDREFVDISSEISRMYMFNNGNTLEIEMPQYLSVSDSGNHYVVDIRGRVYVVAPGWQALTWQPKVGAPHIVA